MHTLCLFFTASAMLCEVLQERQFFVRKSKLAEIFLPSVMLWMFATCTALLSPDDAKLPHGSPLPASAQILLSPGGPDKLVTRYQLALAALTLSYSSGAGGAPGGGQEKLHHPNPYEKIFA
jgi:hypothetical protein